MDVRLRFGMIGCGEIAVATAKGIMEARHASLAAVMDTNSALADEMGHIYDVPWTADVGALLAREDVDAVYIAVPHVQHAPLVRQAAMAGKHVLCEKPLATTLGDADSMIEACRQAGVTLSVAFDAQVSPALEQVRALIAGGAIGEVLGTRIVALMDKPASYWESGWTGRTKSDWRVSREQAGGGVLIMNCIHDINTVRFVTGLEATRVYAEYGTFATPVEVEDYLVATVRYASGAVGHIEAGSCIRGGGADAGPGVRIYGSTGQIVLGNPPLLWSQQTTDGTVARQGGWQEVGSASAGSSRAAIVEGFAVAVLEGHPPPVGGSDGRAALEVVLAAYQAGLDGRPVELGVGMLESGSALRSVELPEGSAPAFVFQPSLPV